MKILAEISGSKQGRYMGALALIFSLLIYQQSPLHANSFDFSEDEMAEAGENQHPEEGGFIVVDHSMIVGLQLTLQHIFYEIKIIEFDRVENAPITETESYCSGDFERILFRRVISTNAP